MCAYEQLNLYSVNKIQMLTCLVVFICFKIYFV